MDEDDYKRWNDKEYVLKRRDELVSSRPIKHGESPDDHGHEPTNEMVKDEQGIYRPVKRSINGEKSLGICATALLFFALY